MLRRYIGEHVGILFRPDGSDMRFVGSAVQMEQLIAAANATAVHTHDGKKATLELVDRGITVRTSAEEPLAIAS